MYPAFAQFQIGGVDVDGEWITGENLQKGDFFSYELCHHSYRECSPFEMDFWIEDKVLEDEEKWIVQTQVYDGNKKVNGVMNLTAITAEPFGSTDELKVYKNTFKSSLVWLSACTKGELKEFSLPSWCKIANIGGEQVMPTAKETVTTVGGIFDTVVISWKTGGYTSKVWIADEFPFPVMASTWVHTNSGIPPQEYKFELLEYKQNVTENPFVNEGTFPEQKLIKCPSEMKSIKKQTINGLYLLDVRYNSNPIAGCMMDWSINFKNKVFESEFLNEIQYDIMVLDESETLENARKVSEENGIRVLYSPSGQTHLSIEVKEKPGTAKYVIYVHGLAPKHIVPSPEQTDALVIEIPITADGKQEEIPAWVKANAEWWADGAIDDNSFVQGIQFLIKEGIIQIPPTEQESSSSNEIPAWVKANAEWWADGAIDDNSFVQGIQFLIKEGFMRVSS